MKEAKKKRKKKRRHAFFSTVIVTIYCLTIHGVLTDAKNGTRLIYGTVRNIQ